MTIFTQKKEFNSDIQKIEIFFDDLKIFEYTGLFKIESLDEYSLAIIQIPINELEQRKITIITANDTTYNIDTFTIPFNQTETSLNTLSKIKKIIIPIDSRFAVFSYEFGIIVSALYDSIKYDDVNKNFFVKYILRTNYGLMALSGSLDAEGHLINERLYSKYLNKFFCVDEFNLDYSIKNMLPKITRELKKQETKPIIEPKIIPFKRILKRK